MTSSLVELHYVIPTSTYPMCDIATMASERDLGESVPGIQERTSFAVYKTQFGPPFCLPFLLLSACVSSSFGSSATVHLFLQIQLLGIFHFISPLSRLRVQT